jgi:AraC family transcriptional regulator of arabinose operon
MSQRMKSCLLPDIHDQLPAFDSRVRTTMQAIAEDPTRTIQELARMAHLSSSRLSHLFKVVTGSSLQAVLSGARLQAAAGILESTEKSIKEVSYNVGYRHSPSFVRAFRKQFGATPNDYRSRQRALLNNS